MTVASTLNRKTFTGDAVTTSFDTSPVVFFSSDDLDVYVVTTATGVATLLTESTHYSVSGGGTPAATGTVSLAGGSSPYGAPAATQTLVIVRNVDLTQNTDFVQNDPSDADVAEAALDRLTMISQQINSTVARSLALDDSDVSGADTTLPTPVANMILGWDGSGTAVINYDPADIGVVLPSAFVSTLVDDANADSFLHTLVAGLTVETAPAVDDYLPFEDLSEQKGNKIRFDDFLKVINALTTEPFASGTADVMAFYDTSATAVRKTTLQTIAGAGIRGYLFGGTLANNGSDATNDIDIGLVRSIDSTNVVFMTASAMTKQLDAAWTAGTNQGMRDTGAIANGTWHIFTIKKDSDGTGDFLASLSPTAPTMPSGYTFFRRIGSILREGGAIVAFSQNGDEYLRSVGVLDVNANNPGAAAVTRTLSVPTGIKVRAIVDWAMTNAAAGVAPHGYVSALDQSDQAPSQTVAPLGNIGSAIQLAVGGEASSNAQVITRTNTSAQVRSRLSASDGNVTLYASALGWIDDRGKYA